MITGPSPPLDRGENERAVSRGAALVGDRIQVADARIEVASRFLRPPEGVTLSGVLGGRSALSSTVAVSTRALLVSHLQ